MKPVSNNADSNSKASRFLPLAIVPVLLACFIGETAFAVGIEKLLMPGRVIEGHAEIEGECAACHDTQSDLAQASLCIECHEEVGIDRDSQTGFHGRFSSAQSSECVICHTDHEGRDADIVPVDAGIFDHEFTDFPLYGAHLSTTCGDCHASGEDYRGASSSCGNCHAADDVHEGALGESCQDCHFEETWPDTSFDHDINTQYVLTGAHVSVQCVDCHRGNQFAQTPKACATCHAIDDVHEGNNGQACQDCHSTATWGSIGFDHLEKTGFALTDGHGGLTCQDCHTRKDFKDGLDGSCAACHLTEDDHQGRNGTECASCHVASRWDDSRFDHGETGFPLVEAHATLNCTACHKDDVEVSLPDTCGGCHALDDSHGGQMGEDCGSCHQQTEWQAGIEFDHDLSGFPLTGMHAPVPCAACHESNRFQDASAGCISCHADDDKHEGTLGSECGACHTSNEWTAAVFDHDTQTGFPLDGSHANVSCSGCHRDTSADLSDVSSSCGGCHKTDDVHDGQFGTDCQRCHNTATFSEVERL